MKEILREIVDQIIGDKKYSKHVEEIWFYGSRAKGTGGKESDIDILVVENADHFLCRLQSLKDRGMSWLDLGDTFESRHLKTEMRKFNSLVCDLEELVGSRIDIQVDSLDGQVQVSLRETDNLRSLRSIAEKEGILLFKRKRK